MSQWKTTSAAGNCRLNEEYCRHEIASDCEWHERDFCNERRGEVALGAEEPSTALHLMGVGTVSGGVENAGISLFYSISYLHETMLMHNDKN